jgi:prepilin-type N-terminal cleavage/methylation domain-containing protein
MNRFLKSEFANAEKVLPPVGRNVLIAPRSGGLGTARPAFKSRGFTLLELLIVLVIIGLLAALILPNLKGMRQSNTMASASRQLLDDLALARQRAIGSRSTVYVVFVPPADWQPAATVNKLKTNEQEQLLTGQFTSYALFTRRQVGDQPGQEHPRFLTGLKSLPDGIFIQTNKFDRSDPNRFDFTNNLPFPSINSADLQLPYIAFDFQGKLVSRNRQERIPLARGAVVPVRGAGGGLPNGLVWDAADVRENPPGNSTINRNEIVIDWLTGRARVERPEIQ